MHKYEEGEIDLEKGSMLGKPMGKEFQILLFHLRLVLNMFYWSMIFDCE